MALERLISGMKCSPGFGGQSGEGKVGAAVNPTSSLWIGRICGSRSLASLGGPSCMRMWACLLFWQRFTLGTTSATKDSAAGREETFAGGRIRGLFLLHNNTIVGGGGE